MLKETSIDPLENKHSATTFLLLDIGERLTSALLIKQVAGVCRLVSRAHVSSTHLPPTNNAVKGVFAAIHKLEQISNQTILTNDNELILHTRQPGRGIDRFFTSLSMGGLLQTVLVAPAVEDPAVESAVHLLQRFPSKIERVFTGANSQDLVEGIQWMAETKPDLVFIVGSDAYCRGSGTAKMLQAIAPVGAGIRQFSDTNRPEVIYAASGDCTEIVQQTMNIDVQFKSTDNLRPDALREHVKPARTLIEDLMRRSYIARIPGLPEVVRWSNETPFVRNEGLAIFGRYQAALANGPVLILDLDVNGGVFGIFPDAPHPVSNPAEFDPAFQAYTFHSTLPYFWLLTRDHKTVAQSLFGCLDKVFVKKIEGGSGAGVNRTGAISTTVPQAARSMSQRNAMNPTETRKVTRAKGGKNGILRPQRRSEAD